MISKLKKAFSDPRKAAGYLLKYFAKYFLRNSPPVCNAAMREVAILSDGSVTTCCLDAKGENRYGNICDNTFDQIWKKGFKRFRKRNLYDSSICITCINGKSQFSPKLISNKKERELWSKDEIPYPRSAVLEISGICNYACSGCFTNELGKYRKAFYDFNQGKDNLKDLLTKIQRLRLYNWGEPLVHKEFPEILTWIRKTAPDLQIDIATNGMLLNEKNIQAIVNNQVNKVIISVHGGPGTENMLKYSNRNADYDKLLINIESLISFRNKTGSKFPFVSLKAVLFEWNDTDELMEQLRKDGKKAGVDRVFWVLDMENGLTSRASNRFKRGTEALKQLVAKGELDGYSK